MAAIAASVAAAHEILHTVSAISGIREEAERLDVAIYAAIAAHLHAEPRPRHDPDQPRGRLFASSRSRRRRCWQPPAGPRAPRGHARAGARSPLTAAVVNLVVKPLGRRRRPDRVAHEVPLARHVRDADLELVPVGPLGGGLRVRHAASAHVSPIAAAPLCGLAALVAYSRVHTGVHYPGDVIAGSLLGVALGQATAKVTATRG